MSAGEYIQLIDTCFIVTYVQTPNTFNWLLSLRTKNWDTFQIWSYLLNMVRIKSTSMARYVLYDCSTHVSVSRHLHTVDHESFYYEMLKLQFQFTTGNVGLCASIADYPASLGVPIIHWYTYSVSSNVVREELIAEVSLTIVTARRRRNSASNRANFDTIASIEHARWGHRWSLRLTDTEQKRYSTKNTYELHRFQLPQIVRQRKYIQKPKL